MSESAFEQLSLGIVYRDKARSTRVDLLDACASALFEVHGVDPTDFDTRREHNAKYGKIKRQFHDDFYYWQDMSSEDLMMHARRVAETTLVKRDTITSKETPLLLVPRLFPVEITLLNWKENI